MEELRDSTTSAGDWAALRDRIGSDGYVFVRGLVDPARAVEAGNVGRAELQRAGWLEPGVAPEAAPIMRPPHATDVAGAWADPGYRAFISSEAFNRLAYEPRLRRCLEGLMGATAFPYPMKVLRVVYPVSIVRVHGGRFVHQDYSVVGVPDMFTVWVPLMEVPRALGGLAVLPGSQRGPYVQPHVLDPREPGWVTTDYHPGDALIFHCLTAHAALPNGTQQLRLSGESRWQLADDPVPARMVLAPQGGGRRELWSRVFGRRDWWRPIPRGLHLVDEPRRDGPIPASRYVDVDPRLLSGALTPPTFDHHPH